LTDFEIFLNISISVACVLFAGAMSGLTTGLASMDRLSLEIAAKIDPEARVSAERIIPVIDKHHWMLVTLLLCNAAAMETLPIYLDRLVPSWAAILSSVTLILFFSEMIP
jgi:metal transporter CNNM